MKTFPISLGSTFLFHFDINQESLKRRFVIIFRFGELCARGLLYTTLQCIEFLITSPREVFLSPREDSRILRFCPLSAYLQGASLIWLPGFLSVWNSYERRPGGKSWEAVGRVTFTNSKGQSISVANEQYNNKALSTLLALQKQIDKWRFVGLLLLPKPFRFSSNLL